MNSDFLMKVSRRWFDFLLYMYPPDFRDDIGRALVGAYSERTRETLSTGGIFGVATIWAVALKDSLRNGLGERVRPAASWRRNGDWGTDMQRVLLVAMGLFGVVSGSVMRRRGELAVRLALGATYGSVVTLVMKDGARRILLGVMPALPGIYFTGRAIRGVLIGVSSFDLLTNIAVAAGLALVALCACYLAARGVRTIEPARMLHDQG